MSATISWPSISGAMERRTEMNGYGTQAMQHWQRWLPSRYAQLEDPEAFFTDLGEQVAEQVSQTVDSLRTSHAEQLAQAEYLERVGLLTNLRMQAQEMVLSEMVLLDPEPGTGDPVLPVGEEDLMAQWMNPTTGMPWDRDHELWAMSEDDDVSLETFRTACREWEQGLRMMARQQLQERTSTP